MNNIEGTIFEDYDSVVFDLDKTIWECFTPEGTSIGAYAMRAPFELKSGLLIKDINGNYCKLQEGIRTLIKSLDADSMNLGIVSSGEQDETPANAQPSVMMLKKFNLHKYFNLYVICKKGINKREYVRPFGRTLFIDDDDTNIDEVKENEKVDVLNRKVFEDWDELFQQKTSTLQFGLASFIIKRANEDFNYTSGADTLFNLYKAELDYTTNNRRLKEGDEVTDDDNVRYLNAKQQIPELFDVAIKYLRDMLVSTIDFSKTRISEDDYPEHAQHHEKLLPRFENALTYLDEASNYTYNEDQWPKVFIAVDNVVNLMHGDLPYVSHLLQEDVMNLENKYDDYAKENNVPGFEAEDNTYDYVMKLEDKWEEFMQFLNRQGKSLEFITTSSEKLSWEVQPELADDKQYWLDRDDMEDIFVMARDYPGDIPRVQHSTLAEQLRRAEGYDFADASWDFEIAKDYSKEPQDKDMLKYWLEVAHIVGSTLRFKEA